MVPVVPFSSSPLEATACFALAVAILCYFLHLVNPWLHERPLGAGRRSRLPPGDMGWPVIGKMWSFLLAFKSGRPDSFIGGFVKRYGRKGIYKTFMFGSPTVLVTVPELCRQVLMDDQVFVPGWPAATLELVGNRSFIGPGVTKEEHKRLRRMTAQPINGYDALSTYLGFIEDTVLSSLTAWSSMPSDEIEFLTELRRMTFRIVMHIFLSTEGESVARELESAYTDLNYGMRAMAIDLPGFAYHRARKARKKLVGTLQSVLDKRKGDGGRRPDVKDMMDRLMEVEEIDGNGNGTGRRLCDEEIIDVLVMYLNAGHESSGHITMWATVLMEMHPEVLRKAKKEQEEIRRGMPVGQKGLTLKEIRKMEYLSKVIDETLRLVNISFVAFRKADVDVDVGGYLIPKGWKVQVWYRNVHMDPLVYPDPKAFNPSRWDDVTPRAGTYLPFGGGSRLCPGNELAKLEISVFLHYFLLDYELVRSNPNCRVRYLPHPRPVDNCKARIKKVSASASL